MSVSFKYYARVSDVEAAIVFYKKVFKAKLIKNDGGHAKVELFNSVPLLLRGNGKDEFKDGKLVLRFSKEDVAEYEDTKKTLKEMGVELIYNDYSRGWGTMFSEFLDPYGYQWVIEI